MYSAKELCPSLTPVKSRWGNSTEKRLNKFCPDDTGKYPQAVSCSHACVTYVSFIVDVPTISDQKKTCNIIWRGP